MKILSTFEIDTILSYSKSLKAKAFFPSKCNLIWILRLLNLLSTSAVLYFPSSNLYLLCGPWNLKLYCRLEAIHTSNLYKFSNLGTTEDVHSSNAHFQFWSSTKLCVEKMVGKYFVCTLSGQFWHRQAKLELVKIQNPDFSFFQLTPCFSLSNLLVVSKNCWKRFFQFLDICWWTLRCASSPGEKIGILDFYNSNFACLCEIWT